jgi:hypothetical protein
VPVAISLSIVGNTLRVSATVRNISDRLKERILALIQPECGKILFKQRVCVLGWMPDEPPAGTKACYREHGGFDGRESK